MKCDVVLQGPLYDYTKDVIDLYLAESWVNDVIVVTWEGQYIRPIGSHRVKFMYLKDVKNPGIGNRNRQITSSRMGLLVARTPVVVKARTDQLILDLPMMKRFYEKFQDGKKIFVCGLYWVFPFHPRDHFAMGPLGEVYDFFDVPHDPVPDQPNPDYKRYTRAEAWLGANYLAKKYPEVRHMIDNYSQYIVDFAPHSEEAIQLSRRLMRDHFAVFPRINMQWPKHGLAAYHYDVGQGYTEYWHDDVWE